MTPTNNKLTLQNKERFFAQHWDQEVLKHGGLTHPAPINTSFMSSIVIDSTGRIIDSYLELKPLFSITDEDAMSVVRMCIGYENYSGGFLDTDSAEAIMDWLNENAYWDEYIQIIDYLRSKKYAIPWNGITVEEMVEAG